VASPVAAQVVALVAAPPEAPTPVEG
jgi:hypothetical protein